MNRYHSHMAHTETHAHTHNGSKRHQCEIRYKILSCTRSRMRLPASFPYCQLLSREFVSALHADSVEFVSSLRFLLIIVLRCTAAAAVSPLRASESDSFDSHTLTCMQDTLIRAHKYSHVIIIDAASWIYLFMRFKTLYTYTNYLCSLHPCSPHRTALCN